MSDAAGELQLFICGPRSSLFTRGSLCAFRICSAPPPKTMETTNMFLSVPRLAGLLTDQNKASGIVVHPPYVCVIDQEGCIRHRSLVGVRPVHVGFQSCMASTPLADASAQDVCCGCALLLMRELCNDGRTQNRLPADGALS